MEVWRYSGDFLDILKVSGTVILWACAYVVGIFVVAVSNSVSSTAV